MLFLPLATTALLSSVAMALPTSLRARQVFPDVPVTFNGAAGTYYTIVVVANSIAVPTNNDLGITSISMEGRADFTCTAYGIDGSVTTLVADQVRKPSKASILSFSSLEQWATLFFLLTRLFVAKCAGWPATGSDFG
jgi:hypothetical protein